MADRRLHIILSGEARDMLDTLARETYRSKSSYVEYLVRTAYDNRPSQDKVPPRTIIDGQINKGDDSPS